MSTLKSNIVHFPVSIIIAAVVTSVLFMGLPLLTKFQKSYEQKERMHAVLISSRKPPKPPEPDRDKKVERKELKKQEQKAKTVTRTVTPRIDLPTGGIGGAIGGSIQISGLTNEFKISDSLFMTAFNMHEVDEKPSVLRSIPLRYPFAAQQKGIEAKITLRFVVDKDGNAQEPQVVKIEPESAAGIFDESAIDTVKKYKFRPAKKNGEAVDCIVKLPLSYELN